MTGNYDYDGNPISMEQWLLLFADEEAKRVAWTDVAEGVEVSTVWLGIDYSFGRGTPLIYETMIFGGKHDQEQWRHPNRTAALAGHDQAVALAREALRGAAKDDSEVETEHLRNLAEDEPDP